MDHKAKSSKVEIEQLGMKQKMVEISEQFSTEAINLKNAINLARDAVRRVNAIEMKAKD
jgi:hypothetical protein